MEGECNFRAVTELDSSWPCKQKPATGTFPEQINQILAASLPSIFNVILPFTSGPTNKTLPLRTSDFKFCSHLLVL